MKYNLFIIFFVINLFYQNISAQNISEIQKLIRSEKFDEAIKKTEKLGDEFKCEKNGTLAQCYWNLNNYSKSIFFYENYIKDCTANYVVRINLGDSYYKTNQLEKAKEQFLIVKKEFPDFGMVDYNLGIIEYDSGNKEKAVEYFTSAVNSTKGKTLDFDYVEMQISTLNELGKYDIALKKIDLILNIWDKNSIEYKYTLIIKSSIFGAKNEYEKAISMLDSIIESGIDYQIVLLEAYSYQLDFYSKLKNEKKACSIYKKMRSLDSITKIPIKFECK